MSGVIQRDNEIAAAGVCRDNAETKIATWSPNYSGSVLVGLATSEGSSRKRQPNYGQQVWTMHSSGGRSEGNTVESFALLDFVCAGGLQYLEVVFSFNGKTERSQDHGKFMTPRNISSACFSYAVTFQILPLCLATFVHICTTSPGTIAAEWATVLGTPLTVTQDFAGPAPTSQDSRCNLQPACTLGLANTPLRRAASEGSGVRKHAELIQPDRENRSEESVSRPSAPVTLWSHVVSGLSFGSYYQACCEVLKYGTVRLD